MKDDLRSGGVVRLGSRIRATVHTKVYGYKEHAKLALLKEIQ